MTTFADYVEYYNNHDVIGLVEGIEKMIEIQNKKKLDMFKDSVSLPGLVQKYLMKNFVALQNCLMINTTKLFSF